MQIRNEDRRSVRSLSLIGAMICACFFPLVIFREYQKQQVANNRQAASEREAAALRLFESSSLAAEKLGSSTQSIASLARDIRQQQQQQEAPACAAKSSLWTEFVRLPLWAVWGICAVAIIVGWLAGYNLVWLMALVGSIVMYKFIRGVYGVVKLTPLCQRQKTRSIGSVAKAGYVQRNNGRLFPLVIRFFILMSVGLAVLACLILYFTA